jgi:hypothetical protein
MDQDDPFGFYHLLGVTPWAPMKKIKAAGPRRPYYIPSGDESDKAFAEAFRRTSDAYAVLTDPVRRANYDWFARNLPAEAIEPDGSVRYDLGLIPDGPLHCSRCGQITLQPRYVTLSYVERGGYEDRVVDKEALLCVRCARVGGRFKSVGWMADDLISPFIGADTPSANRRFLYFFYALFKVGLGEKHDRLTDEKLILHNARAFLARGDTKTAYGLAKLIWKFRNKEIAGEAAEILRVIAASGAYYSGYALKDDWALSDRKKLFYRLMVFVVPAMVIVAMYVSDAQETTPGLQPLPAGVAAPRCEHPPETSEVLSRQAGAQGDLTLRIRNASGHKAIVKVRDRNSALVATLFLRGEESVDLRDLPGGNYRIQFAIGSMFDATCRAFLDTGAIFELHEFNKRVISSFSTGREIIGYDLETDISTHRRLSLAGFEQGS